MNNNSRIIISRQGEREKKARLESTLSLQRFAKQSSGSVLLARSRNRGEERVESVSCQCQPQTNCIPLIISHKRCTAYPRNRSCCYRLRVHDGFKRDRSAAFSLSLSPSRFSTALNTLLRRFPSFFRSPSVSDPRSGRKRDSPASNKFITRFVPKFL